MFRGFENSGLKMKDLKNRIEALLFSSGKKMGLAEICRLCRIKQEDAVPLLSQLKSDYDSKNSSLLLIDDGDGWKLTVREEYSKVVRRIVAETELTKSVMETLAVIAWKVPVLQSDIISIRTNKAYDHLVELEKSGFISRSKSGRTKLIKLTDRFFNYFDVKNAEAMKERFKVKEPEPKETTQTQSGEQPQAAENVQGGNSNENPETSPDAGNETDPDANAEASPGTDSKVSPGTDTEVSPEPDVETNPGSDSEISPDSGDETNPGSSETESDETENRSP